jgi:hypothetical protein
VTFSFKATLAHVANRGRPPVSFLAELLLWARHAPDEIFVQNDRYDIYSSVKPDLGPWVGLLQRKAAMCEVLRVLPGFESSWNWLEGRDVTNKTSDKPWTEEAGIFQVSADATKFDSSLVAFVIRRIGEGRTEVKDSNGHTIYAYRFDCTKFIAQMKIDHSFAIEFAARLLRFTVKHNGPVLRKEINPFLSRQSAAEFQTLLAA